MNLKKTDNVPCVADENIEVQTCETSSSPITETPRKTSSPCIPETPRETYRPSIPETPLTSESESTPEFKSSETSTEICAAIDIMSPKPQTVLPAVQTPIVPMKNIGPAPLHSSNWRTTKTEPPKSGRYSRRQLWDISTTSVQLNPTLHKLLIDRELFQKNDRKAIEYRRAEELARKPPKPAIVHISLSLHEDVKLNESENAWKPSHITKSTSQNSKSVTTENQTEVLYRKVRGILNRLTPEFFEKLLEQIQCLNIDTNEKLQGVILLVFEKAIDEQLYAKEYALLCKNLSCLAVRHDDQNRDTFLSKLLVKCEQEFNVHVMGRKKFDEKHEEEERQSRRRSVGTCRFVGELYNSHVLKHNIMTKCINNLLESDPNGPEEYLECLCTLLTTIGPKMDAENVAAFSSTFKVMSEKIRKRKLSNRVKFMMQDVIDLRNRKWTLRTGAMDSVPKTMEQCEQEIKIKAAAAMLAPPSQPMPLTAPQWKNARSHNGERQHNDRPTPVAQSVNLLKSSQPVLAISNMRKGYGNGSDTVLGHRGQYNWSASQKPSQQPPLPTKLVPTTISSQQPTKPKSVANVITSRPKQMETDIDVPDKVLDTIKNTIRDLMELPVRNKVERYESVDVIPVPFKWAGVRELFNVCVETLSITTDDRFRAGNKCSKWLETGTINVEQFVFGLTDFFNAVEDLIIDVPKILTYIVELLWPILRDGHLKDNHLFDAAKSVRESSLADQFQATLNEFLIKELGDETKAREMCAGWIRRPQMDDHSTIMLHIDRHLKQNANIGEVYAYILNNVTNMNGLFVRKLTTSIIRSSSSIDKNRTNNNDVSKRRVTDSESCRISVNEMKLVKNLMLLKRLFAEWPKLAIECLYAIQLHMHALEHPQGLVTTLMHIIYDNDVMSPDTFLEWEKSTIVPEGKGVCVKSLKSLLDLLHQSDDEG